MQIWAWKSSDKTLRGARAQLVKRPTSAQVIISWLVTWALHWALCWWLKACGLLQILCLPLSVPPLLVHALSCSHSLSNIKKILKKFKKLYLKKIKGSGLDWDNGSYLPTLVLDDGCMDVCFILICLVLFFFFSGMCVLLHKNDSDPRKKISSGVKL